MMTRPTKTKSAVDRNRIYDSLLKDAKPAVLPPPWERVECHPAFCRLPKDLSRTLDRLRREFSEEALVAAGVLVQPTEGGPCLNPLLIEHGNYLFAAEKANEVGPHQLVAGLRAIGSHQWCVASALHDPRLVDLLPNVDSQMFVAYSQVDLAIAWSVGLPAIPATNLESIGNVALDVICKKLNLRRASDDFNPETPQKGRDPASYPVLINWSLAELAPTEYPEARLAEGHFLELQRHLGVDLADGAIWTPTAADLETLKFRIKFGQLSDVMEALIASSAEAATFGALPPAEPGMEPKRYFDALQDWIACSNGDDKTRCQKAWDRLQRFQDSELVIPLLDQASRESEPLPRILLTSLAEVARVFHPQALLTSVKFTKAVRDQGLKASSQLPTEQFQQVISLTDRMIAIAEGVQACRSKKFKSVAKVLKSMKEPPSSKPSNSAPKKPRR